MESLEYSGSGKGLRWRGSYRWMREEELKAEQENEWGGNGG